MTARPGKGREGARSRAKDTHVQYQDILERLAARDKRALLELHARMAPGLLGITSRIASDPRDAAWAVEEAFVHLWREAAHFPRDAASVPAWLVLNVRRYALQKRGSVRGLPQGSTPARESIFESYSWLPSHDAIDQLESRSELLRKTLRQLPKHQQDALTLAVWEGLSVQSIAERLGEPLAKVQSSLRAGMRFIRHRMSVVLGKWSAPI
jgi:RNA polymerase sigma-70 factor (ECF subfamily)